MSGYLILFSCYNAFIIHLYNNNFPRTRYTQWQAFQSIFTQIVTANKLSVIVFDRAR